MNTRRKPAIAIACAALGYAGSASAEFQCYDFSGAEPDQSYTVGDVIDTKHATITFKQYVTGGTPATAAERHAASAPSQIAGGEPPEVRLYLISVNIKPDQPITRLRMKVAQAISENGGFANANIEVNGKKHESPDGIAGMNGKTISRRGKGRVEIISSMAPHEGNWQSGTLELHATDGHIESVTIGGHSMLIDDVCIGKE